MNKLLPFQETAVDEIQKRIRNAITNNTPDIICLEAPTGAGKTFITAKSIEPFIKDNIIIYMSYYPSINNQTLQKLRDYGINNVEIIDKESGKTLEPNIVYFINFQKLGKNKNLEEDSDISASLETRLRIAADSYKIIVVIDEAHFGSSNIDKSSTQLKKMLLNQYISVFLAATATPKRFKVLVENINKTLIPVAINYEEPKNAKLLKESFYVMSPSVHTSSTVPITICQEALKEYKIIKHNWQEHGIQTLLIVQIENLFDKNEPGFINEFIDIYSKIIEPIGKNEIRHCFGKDESDWSIEYVAPEEIEDKKQIKVVFFKTALTTGWDCPRAEMLISLRTTSSETSIIQLVGRMLRNPKGFQVGNEELDKAYLYLPKYDSEIVKKLKEEYNSVNIESNSTKIEMVKNSLYSIYEERLQTLRTKQRLWKGKNVVQRLREIENKIGGSKLDKDIAIDLNNKIEILIEEILLEVKKQLSVANKSKETLSMVTESNITHKIEIVSESDMRRISEKRIESIKKSKNGMPEKELKNLDLIGIEQDKIERAIESAYLATNSKLEAFIEYSRSQIPHASFRDIKKMLDALTSSASIFRDTEWTVPSHQTCSSESKMTAVKKSFYSYNNEINYASEAELKYIKYLESDELVLCYVKNPQKYPGLAIDYDYNGESCLTYPDFIVIYKNNIKIVEVKGGQNIASEEYKYNGLKRYSYEDVETEWVEWYNNELYKIRPQNIEYDDRLQTIFKF